MKTFSRRILWAFLAAFLATCPLAASTAVIKGVVTDDSGKPIRGAVISAKSGIKTISRFSQNDGKYEIVVASAGTFEVTVDAYGFAIKRASVDTGKAGETDFRLSPANLSLGRLTGSELESLLPDTQETRLLRSHCVECHSLPTIVHRRGQSASEWKDFLPHMTNGATEEPFANATPQELDALSAALDKDFGPDSPYFNMDADASQLKAHVKHVEPSDEALRATLIQYDVPTKISRPHSIEIDLKTNVAWFGEESYFGNKAARFNMETENFQEYPLLTEKARPHTGAVASDGRYWVALAHTDDPAKLASVDPETGEVKQYYWPEKKAAAHTLTLDRSGNVWFSGGTSGDLWSFDVKKQQFFSHAYAVPAGYPKNTMQDWGEIPGESHPAQGRSYDVTVDNEGMVWFSEIALGTIVKLNPATGETKDIHPEGTVSIRGITVDPSDNLWFGDFLGHRFGKLNVKTGAVKFYKPPTPNATVYGVTYNQADGTIWFADMSGNNITRFNTKTETFTEFPIPQRPDRSYARFISADVKGRVWFTEYFGDRIGFVDPTGESTGSQINSKRASVH